MADPQLRKYVDISCRYIEPYRPYSDLLLVVGYTVVAATLLLLPVLPTGLRIPVAIPLLLFTPGYAFVAALFPKIAVEPGPTYEDARLSGPRYLFDGLVPLERLSIAVVTSATLVPMVAYGLSQLVPLGLSGVCFCVTLVTVGCSAVAGGRRDVAVDDGDQWTVTRVRHRLLDRLDIQSRVDVLPVVAVGLTLVMVAISGAAVLGDATGEPANTELSLLTEAPNGNLTMGEYKQTFAPQEPGTYSVRIEQHTALPKRYTLVVALEQFASADGESVVRSRKVLDRRVVFVSPDRPRDERIRVSPSGPPREARLVVLLYDGNLSGRPTREEALRTVNIPVEITE